MNTPSIISCTHVSLAYGRQEVIHEACLEISRGTLLPFVGPNGAGKTTLLRAILGLLKPSQGEIRTPFTDKPAGYVPQQKNIDPLYPISTRQIVEMGLYPELGAWRRPNAQQRQRVNDVLVRFGLVDHQNKTFGELSGGMKQKALLGRALVSGAEVFVMDEPTSELDEETEKDVLSHLVTLVQQEGKTVLLAHHGLDQAAQLADRVCVVNHGDVHLATIAEAHHRLRSTSRATGGNHHD